MKHVEFINYLVDYINEEIDRNNIIDYQTIVNALEAFLGGAR